MINHLYQKTTYWIAGLAVIFIVSFAFAQKDESAQIALNLLDSKVQKTTYLAKLSTSKNSDSPSKNTSLEEQVSSLVPVSIVPISIIEELDQRIHAYPQDYEASLLKILAYIEAGDFKTANILLDDLLRKSPDFTLAHLVKGDLIAMQIKPIQGLGQNDILKSFSNEKNQATLSKLRDEVKIRLKNYHTKLTQQKIPRSLLLMSKSINIAILIDKSKNRLYVYRRQNDLLPPKLIQDFYVSTGKLRGNKRIKGDLKTPEGVYFVTKWIPDSSLPDKYGVGAFPVNYPNELDNRLGKTGYGIWLHGTNRQSYSRPPLDSEGCVVLPNIDLAAIKHLITPGKTPLIIAESIEWVDYAEWSNIRKNVLSSIEQWRKDWQSLNVDKYLQHYGESFWSNTHNIKSWRARKKAISQAKTYQKIHFDDISLFAYPDQASKQDIVVARFHQSYQSNNYKSDMNKRLYLTQSNAFTTIKERSWKIIFEGK